MITYICMIWFATALHAPTWLCILLGVGFTINCISFCINLAEKSKGKKGE